ncbi:MAG TPA: DUF6580 family putative transport protein [Opitutaceae bacterium]|nr:DUF6580 family putative transport protein [Opitutaceae bacterium]
MPLALLFLVLAAGWRVVALYVPDLMNFAPLMALTFCGAVYFRDKRMWLVPFAALTLSDLYLDHYYATVYHETWTWPSVALRLACFALALPIGAFVAARKNWLTLFAGAFAGSLFFYFATNTDAWLRDPYYVKSAAGWVQAMTVGRPQFPPTIWFFRNTLASDLLFTGLFAAAMEFAALRAGRESLLAKHAKA